MSALRSRTAGILTFAAFGLCSLLDHAAISSGTPLGAGLTFVQFSLVGALILSRSTYRHRWALAALAAVLVAAFCWQAVRTSLVAASALPHTLAYSGLLAVFGASLLPGREALVTALARQLHGPITSEMAGYTRQVTWAWCVFFGAQLATSLLLFLFAPLAAWSFFVNVLNLPLLVLMFALEYAYRGIALQNPPRHGVAYMTAMAAFLKQRMSKPTGAG